MRRFVLGVVGAMAAGLLAAEPLFAFSFSVEPARIELTIPAGKQRGKTVRVNNARADAPIHVKIYAQDVIFLPDGTNDFPAPGSTAWSCAKWVRAIPQELDIPAGKSQDVRISIAVPEGMQGGYYAMVFFETHPSYVEKGIGINFRIGALTQVTIPNTEMYQAKLADMTFPKMTETQIEIFNEGNVLIRPKGKVKIFNAAKKKVAQVEFNPMRLGILPKSLRKFPTALGTLAPGAYQLKAEIDYGTRYLLVGERQFEIK